MSTERIGQYRIDSLVKTFYVEAKADKADAKYRRFMKSKGGERRLAWLLRHHEAEPPHGAETVARDQFDFLLAYYSLRELAATIGYAPMIVDASLDNASVILDDPAVTRFREQHYPLLLPAMALARLQGRWQPCGENGGRAHGLFEEFLQLVRRRNEDDDIDTFLWFLDDGYFGEDNIDQTLKLLGDPDRVAQALKSSPHRRSWTESSVVGFASYLRFLMQLAWLLEQASDYPLLRSGMWHYNAYWLTAMRQKFRRMLVKSIHLMTPWASVAGNAVEAADQQQLLFDSVFDERIGIPYLEAATTIVRPELLKNLGATESLQARMWSA